MTTKRNQPTAFEIYAQHHRDVVTLVLCLEFELEAHLGRAKKKPENWGFPGELEGVKKHLIDAFASLSHNKPTDIHEQLNEMRRILVLSQHP
jgi:hypothetical protein